MPSPSSLHSDTSPKGGGKGAHRTGGFAKVHGFPSGGSCRRRRLMRGRLAVFELHRVFESKRGNISKHTTLLLIWRFAPPSPQGEGFGLRVSSRKKILPPHIHGTRASLLRGATQVQRGFPSLVCRLFRGGVRRFRRGAPYTRARRMSFAPAAAGSFQQLLPSLTGVRRYCFRVTAMMNF